MSILSITSLSRRSLQFFVTASAVLLFVVWLSYRSRQSGPDHDPGRAPTQKQLEYHCSNLNGADDALLVVRTRAGQAQQALPAHFESTFHCVRNYVIYSDAADKIEGYLTHDVLGDFDVKLREKIAESRPQRRSEDDTFKTSDPVLDSIFTAGNENWYNEKWKLIPILEKAFKAQPSAKWFIFINADSYIIWSNVLRWLEQYDSRKPIYFGEPMKNEEGVYGHSNAGYILSNAALRMVIEAIQRASRQLQVLVINNANEHRALETVMDHIHLQLSDAWPAIQNDSLESIDYAEPSVWCTPAGFYQSMKRDETIDLWQFEQGWLRYYDKKGPIYHKDVFERFVQPIMGAKHRDWDNLSLDRVINSANATSLETEVEKKAPDSYEGCERLCESEVECLQLSFLKGECRLGRGIKLGLESAGIQSGWMTERIYGFADAQKQCNESWIQPHA